MHKGVWIIIAALCVVVAAVLLTLAVYSIPFVKGNNSIVAANKTLLENQGDTDWISFSNLKKLQIVDDETIEKDRNISIKTKVKPTWTAWDKVSIHYEITATAKDWDTNEIVSNHQGSVIMHFRLAGFRWVVDEVNFA